jgi:hypothetical protein
VCTQTNIHAIESNHTVCACSCAFVYKHIHTTRYLIYKHTALISAPSLAAHCVYSAELSMHEDLQSTRKLLLSCSPLRTALCVCFSLSPNFLTRRSTSTRKLPYFPARLCAAHSVYAPELSPNFLTGRSTIYTQIALFSCSPPRVPAPSPCAGAPELLLPLLAALFPLLLVLLALFPLLPVLLFATV